MNSFNEFQSPFDYLYHLVPLFPVEGVIVVGAGSGTGTDSWLQLLRKMSVGKALLIEAVSARRKLLQSSIQDVSGWRVEEKVVGETFGNAVFYTVSNTSESGLVDPSLLRELWPNLVLQGETPCEMVTLEHLAGGMDFSANWLVVDCLPGLDILRGAGETLTQFDVVVVRAILDDHIVPGMNNSHTRICVYMAERGFRPLSAKQGRHPALGHGVYVRDYVRLANLQKEVNKKLEADYSALLKSHQDQSRQAELPEELINEMRELVHAQNERVVEIGKDIENRTHRNILGLTKQLEAFIGIHYFLNQGELIPGMHGWPVSPDFALFLMETIVYNDYDIILEFGSGTSTVLIAKTLKKIAGQRSARNATVQVAFEHLEQYHIQTTKNLRQVGLEENVEMVYAPLTPFIAPNGIEYSYYSCHGVIEELAQKNVDQNLKILLVVDGPPSTTGRHARYPAVPSVLKTFNFANIDILLDDYRRSDEKEIVDMWTVDIEKNEMIFEKIEKKMEKDACLIRVTTR